MSDLTLRLTRRTALVFAAAPLFAPALVFAQTAGPGAPGSAGADTQPPPARIGNRWDSLAHQPTEADVGAAEQELGLAGTPDHDRQVDKELKDIGDELLNAEQHDGPGSPR